MKKYNYTLSYILLSLIRVAYINNKINFVDCRVGESYTGSTAFDSDSEEWDRSIDGQENEVGVTEQVPHDHLHQEQQCGIYYAPSIIDADNFALYATKEYTGVLSDQDLIVPIINANKNEYSPWHDFVWSQEFIPETMRSLKYDLNETNVPIPVLTREYFIAGIAATTPCTSNPYNNVKPNYDLLYYGSLSDINSNSEISGDGISDYNNFIIETTTTLRPGQMILNECSNEIKVPENNNELLHPDIDSLRNGDGICMDTIQVRPSSIPGIGRGAFSKYTVPRGNVVATSPVVHFDRSQMNIVLQSIIHDEKDHTIPLIYRPHNIEYSGGKKILGQQLLLNYCYGHPSSNMLLLPYGPGVNFINHQSGEDANVMIRWSNTKLTAASTTFRTSTPLMEMYEQPAGTSTTNLMIEFIAIKDILPGDEIFLNYGNDFINAWEEHVLQLTNLPSQQHNPFRYEIGVPDGFYSDTWMRADPNPSGDFIASPLAPGHMAPIRWKGSAEIVTPWAFRVGLPSRVRKVLLNYCNKMGITDILRHVTVDGNGLLPGTETHMELEGDDWYLQRPDAIWRSNLHWFSPGAGPAHEHYLQALGVAGFDTVLQGIGEYLGMDGLVAFHVTFIAGSFSNRGFMHFDVRETGAKVYNIIIPLLLANETGPELDVQSWKSDLRDDQQIFRVGRCRYEYNVATMVGDGAVHATSACDYRYRQEMRMAATVYVADVNDINAANVMRHYTQAYPPRELDLLKSWIARHWKRGDPSRMLPKPSLDHILIRDNSKHDSGKIWKASPSRGRILSSPSEPLILINTNETPTEEL